MADKHTTINIEKSTLERLGNYCGKTMRRSAVLSEIVNLFLDGKEKETGTKY